MIHCSQPPEPPDFDAACRQAGLAWLEGHPGQEPRDLWSPFRPALREGFRRLCAYAAMHVQEPGTVDHFVPKSEEPALAYEWANYRFCSSTMNSWKGACLRGQILDPHDVREGWFEILLPSLQLRTTDAVPEAFRDLADSTLRRLKLQDDERIIAWRMAWYSLYLEGHLDLTGLEAVAPLIASAVRKQALHQTRPDSPS